MPQRNPLTAQRQPLPEKPVPTGDEPAKAHICRWSGQERRCEGLSLGSRGTGYGPEKLKRVRAEGAGRGAEEHREELESPQELGGMQEWERQKGLAKRWTEWDTEDECTGGHSYNARKSSHSKPTALRSAGKTPSLCSDLPAASGYAKDRPYQGKNDDDGDVP